MERQLEPLVKHTIKPFQPLINRLDKKEIDAMKEASRDETAVIDSGR